ncbi:heterokaryon incompatibility protein-domain-containing protein [Pestalotiopsis sp. NC0098]|nr:heterokaryon incompatibility protein-domain-containing protein [Pestalotiopsis sp. NC0098]
MYTHLDASQAEIRLLSVVPCREYAAKVSCRITIAQLHSSPPRYAALSYVWGNAADTEEIVVNDRPFQATKSLASALRQFRASYVGKDDGPSLLWADAVCINQQDLAERAQQVSMMGAIYTKASWVISWLGPSDESTEAAFSLIKACAAHVEAAAKESGEYPKPAVPFSDADLEFLGQDTRFYEQNAERFAKNQAWNAIDNLSSHVYWTRIWIIQEVALARSPDTIIIHCGSECVTFRQIGDFNLFAERFLDQKPQKPSFFNQRVWDWIIHDNELNLSFVQFMDGLRKSAIKDDYRLVAMISMSCSSTDPRDAVFGLAGLIDGDIVPDYTKQHVDVYKDFVAAVLRHKKYKNFFCSSGLIRENRDASGFPSWVPRFDTLKEDAYYLILPPDAFVAAWLDQLHPEGPKIIDDHRIQFVGIRLDCCTNVIRFAADPDPDPFEDSMKQFWWTCLEFLSSWDAKHVRGDIRPLERLLSAMTKGRDTQHRPLDITPSLQCLTAHAFRIMLRGGEPEDNELSNERYGRFGYASLEEARLALDDAFIGPGAPDISTLSEALTPTEYEDAINAFNQMIRILSSQSNRPLFVTKNGFVGVAPPAVANGDLVCLLEGSSIPFLLREMGQDYVLVGSCYVKGYSDGEPLQLLENGTLRLEEFNIR